MPLWIFVIPALIFFGLIGLGLYCMWKEAQDKKAGKRPVLHHPDSDLPLYNRGHCDAYSAGIFDW